MASGEDDEVVNSSVDEEDDVELVCDTDDVEDVSSDVWLVDDEDDDDDDEEELDEEFDEDVDSDDDEEVNDWGSVCSSGRRPIWHTRWV